MKGTINAFDERAGVLYISCPILGDISDVLDKSSEVEVILKDAREITPAQRRCIHALVHDITSFISGYAEKRHVIAETMNALELNYLIDTADSEEVRFILTNNYCRLTGIDFFSLSARSENTIDQSTALYRLARKPLCGECDSMLRKPFESCQRYNPVYVRLCGK